MKFRIFTLALLLVGFTCQAQNQIDRQGRKQGHWIKTDKDGSKIFEGNFKDGVEVGLFQYFYPNGKVRIENNFTSDGKFCSHKAYDEEGHLLATGFFRQRNRDSVWNFYNEEGRLLKTTHYLMGLKHGRQIIFAANGDTAEVSSWDNNHRHGYWWKRIGKKGYITGTYNHGKLNGEVLEYDDQQQLCRKGNYLDGQKHGSYKYYENKQLSVDETWNIGTLQDRRILILQPEPAYISIYSIAYLIPKGKDRVTIYNMRGEAIETFEPIDNLVERIGDERFSQVNKKNHMMVAEECIVGIKQDSEGRDILDLSPEIPIQIFPDEDCVKLVKSIQREGMDQ